MLHTDISVSKNCKIHGKLPTNHEKSMKCIFDSVRILYLCAARIYVGKTYVFFTLHEWIKYITFASHIPFGLHLKFQKRNHLG